jgi:hypothetical protein
MPRRLLFLITATWRQWRMWNKGGISWDGETEVLSEKLSPCQFPTQISFPLAFFRTQAFTMTGQGLTDALKPKVRLTVINSFSFWMKECTGWCHFKETNFKWLSLWSDSNSIVLCTGMPRYLFLMRTVAINPLNFELNSICQLLALLGAHFIFHVSRIRVNISDIIKL